MRGRIRLESFHAYYWLEPNFDKTNKISHQIREQLWTAINLHTIKRAFVEEFKLTTIKVEASFE